MDLVKNNFNKQLNLMKKIVLTKKRKNYRC